MLQWGMSPAERVPVRVFDCSGVVGVVHLLLPDCTCCCVLATCFFQCRCCHGTYLHPLRCGGVLVVVVVAVGGAASGGAGPGGAGS